VHFRVNLSTNTKRVWWLWATGCLVCGTRGMERYKRERENGTLRILVTPEKSSNSKPACVCVCVSSQQVLNQLINFNKTLHDFQAISMDSKELTLSPYGRLFRSLRYFVYSNRNFSCFCVYWQVPSHGCKPFTSSYVFIHLFRQIKLLHCCVQWGSVISSCCFLNRHGILHLTLNNVHSW
jgi:hypothetical protein